MLVVCDLMKNISALLLSLEEADVTNDHSCVPDEACLNLAHGTDGSVHHQLQQPASI